MKNLNAPYKIVCAKCGSDDIMGKSWFNPNTGENFGWDNDDLCFCNKCNEMTPWDEIDTRGNKKAYLVSIAPIVRVVIGLNGKSEDEAIEEAIRVAIQKVLKNPKEFINDENVETAFEDTECPAGRDEPITEC